MSAQSLQKLVGLSDSAHLAPHIHTLHFHPDEDMGLLGRGLEWSRDTSGGLTDPLAGASGILQDILKNKIVNCSSFHIEHYDEINMHMDSPWLTPGDVVSIVYLIVVNANLQVESLRIDGDRMFHGRLSTERLLPFVLHHEQEHQEGLLMWKSLESLVWKFHLMIDQYDWALNLLKNASGLRELWLRLDNRPLENRGADNSTFFRHLSALGPFHAIESLTLNSVTLNGTALSRYLLQHANTLRYLKLLRMQLAPDSANEETGTSWETVFGDMIGQMGRLQYVFLFRLFEPKGVGEVLCVCFPSLSSFPVVPGSQQRRCRNTYVTHDKRVVPTLESPIRLRYTRQDRKRLVWGVAYEGRKVDEFLGLLVKGKDVFTPL